MCDIEKIYSYKIILKIIEILYDKEDIFLCPTS